MVWACGQNVNGMAAMWLVQPCGWYSRVAGVCVTLGGIAVAAVDEHWVILWDWQSGPTDHVICCAQLLRSALYAVPDVGMRVVYEEPCAMCLNHNEV